MIAGQQHDLHVQLFHSQDGGLRVRGHCIGDDDRAQQPFSHADQQGGFPRLAEGGDLVAERAGVDVVSDHQGFVADQDRSPARAGPNPLARDHLQIVHGRQFQPPGFGRGNNRRRQRMAAQPLRPRRRRQQLLLGYRLQGGRIAERHQAADRGATFGDRAGLVQHHCRHAAGDL